MIDYHSIGKNIRRHRNRLGITQEALAEKVNVSIPHISRIENGSAKPSLQTLVDVCNALDVPLDYLMRDSIHAAQRCADSRLDEVLADCSAQEMDMIADVAEAVLRNMRK